MKIKPFSADDINAFLNLAAMENWVAEAWEFEFLLSEFPEGCFSAFKENGETAGYVTSLLHEQSGWIGNLIVAQEFRGRGVGEALFKKALEALQIADAETIWLTASSDGKSLYEKYGFKKVDKIIRWTGAGRQSHSKFERKNVTTALNETTRDIDCLSWGDRRDDLLSKTVARGSLLHDTSGFIVTQPCGDATQFGPFSARDSATAERLLDMALRTVPFGSKIYLDAPASNRAALRMFNRRRLIISGTSELMYWGKRPEYRPELLYGLASMGSCG
jgi:ribosomal protein S18 acetylase RimI-like enzyme